MLLLVLLGMGSRAWADNETTVQWPVTTALPSEFTSVGGDDNVKIKISSTNTYTNPLRFYANVTTTITAADGYVLKSVTYQASSTGNYVTYAQNATVSPNVTPSVSGKDVTWTFDNNVTEFTFSPSTQTRCSSLSITYAPSGGDTPATPTCATPTFSPEAGAVASGTEVTITSTEGATIYYTTDGNDPTTSSNVYAEPIAVTADMTIKAYAVKDGCTDSEVAEAAYTIKQAVPGYAIDFESDLDCYTDWTFDGIGIHTSGLTCGSHDAEGSAWGSNVNSNDNGVGTASITTNDKIANPGVFTCYISKESGNTSSSTWKIQVSSDGNTWEDIASASTMTQNSWTELSGNLQGYSNVYVRL